MLRCERNVLFKLAILLSLLIICEQFDIRHFSTKTPYIFNDLKGIAGDFNAKPDCKLIFMNGLFRHGSRGPPTKSKKKFAAIQSKLSQIIDPDDVVTGFLKSKFDFTGDRELFESGQQEHFDLAQRIRTKLQNYALNSDNIQIISSSVSRCILSAKSFIRGLGIDVNLQDQGGDNIAIKDSLIRFYDSCEKYIEEVKNSEESEDKTNEYGQSKFMLKAVETVVKSRKLEAANLTVDDFSELFTLCGYYRAKDPLKPPTDIESCNFIPGELALALEYFLTMKQYWKKSYPHEISFMQACPLLNGMFDQIQEAANQHQETGSNKHVGSFWFGHAETLLPIEALLGLFRPDEHLSSDNYKTWLNLIKDPASSQYTPNNLFKTSHVAPFAGNLQFQLFHCTGQSTNTYQLQLLLNEQPVKWSYLTDVTSFSDLDSVLANYRFCSPPQFDLSKECQLNSAVKFANFDFLICLGLVIHFYLRWNIFTNHQNQHVF